MHELDADSPLDALHRRTRQTSALGEFLLTQTGTFAGLADTAALLLAGETDPLWLISRHPTTLDPQ